jgi:hypothetical protein
MTKERFQLYQTISCYFFSRTNLHAYYYTIGQICAISCLTKLTIYTERLKMYLLTKYTRIKCPGVTTNRIMQVP